MHASRQYHQFSLESNLQFAVFMDGFLAAAIDRVVNFHDCCLITTPVTIIGSRKDGHDASVVLPLVSLHHQLMGSGYEMQPVNMSKLLRNVLAKGVSSTPR